MTDPPGRYRRNYSELCENAEPYNRKLKSEEIKRDKARRDTQGEGIREMLKNNAVMPKGSRKTLKQRSHFPVKRVRS